MYLASRWEWLVSEIALSVLLLIGPGLLIKSFLLLRDVNPGFDPENVLTMLLALFDPRYSRDIHLQPAFFRELKGAANDVSDMPGRSHYFDRQINCPVLLMYP